MLWFFLGQGIGSGIRNLRVESRTTKTQTTNKPWRPPWSWSHIWVAHWVVLSDVMEFGTEFGLLDTSLVEFSQIQAAAFQHSHRSRQILMADDRPYYRPWKRRWKRHTGPKTWHNLEKSTKPTMLLSTNYYMFFVVDMASCKVNPPGNHFRIWF